MLPPDYLYWIRIGNKHMTEPWLDQALMDSAYRREHHDLVLKINVELTSTFLLYRGLVHHHHWILKVLKVLCSNSVYLPSFNVYTAKKNMSKEKFKNSAKDRI